jgi:bifunctional DNA-binding transcriptional regulator/antitoxin component of YhaV-PrlF toxin-antitoxin module
MPKGTKARSRLTAQGQVSVPVRVRETLGLAAGSVLEWETLGGHAVVRRAGANSSADIHSALFAATPARRTLKALKEGIRKRARACRARD